MINQVFCEDCLTTIERLDGVDFVITSPPYNMNRRVHTGKYTKRTQSEKDISTKYSQYSDDLMPDEYFEWQKQVIERLMSKTKKYIFYNIQPLTGNKLALFKLMGHFAEYIKEIIIWDKVNAEPAIQTGILNSQFEFIIVFSANPEIALTRHFDAPFKRGTLSNLVKIGKNSDTSHSGTNAAKMPDKLARWLIQNFTNEGDLIYDPFCGTGTTLVQSKLLGRNYIGSDVVQECVDITNQTLARTTNMTTNTFF